jgi:hypothetical protein
MRAHACSWWLAKLNQSSKWYRWDGDDLILSLCVQPRARQDCFDGLLGDVMKIRLRAPPIEDKANQSLMAFIAKAFGVKRGQVLLLSGDKSRFKRLKIRACPHKNPDTLFQD